MEDTNTSVVESTPNTSPVESSTPVEAPTSVDAALDQHFTAQLTAEAPAAETPATDGDVPTTEAPPAEVSDATKQGPIPFTAHKQALENARQKAAAETEQRLVQEWQTQIEPIKPYALAIAQDMQANSIEGLVGVMQQYAQHPQLGPQFRSLVGRMLSQQRGQQQPAVQEQARPEPDLQTADGALVYSAERAQQLMEWNQAQTLKQFQEQMQPLVQDRAQREQAQRVEAAKTQAWNYAAQTLQRMRQADPDFATHEKAVQERMTADPSLSLEGAYLAVLREVVIPSKVAQSQQSWLETAAKKSRGSSPDPGTSAPAQPRRGRTVDEQLDHVFNSFAS
jgi:hypothetical protein